MKKINRYLYNFWILKLFIVMFLYYWVADEIEVNGFLGIVIKSIGAFVLILMFTKPKDIDK